jgi:hypothetical protein
MSTPQNILAKYRTYSYHHILIACDNEASAEYIRNSQRLSAFRDLSMARPVRIDEETGNLQVVDRRDEASGQVNQNDVGRFVVVLNGMIDTSYVVKSVEWFTATAANAEAQDAFTSIGVEGKMMVEEPRGVRFLNSVNGAADLLQTDPSGVIWMLKTIFIGHNDNGEQSDYIVDLRPLEFMMYDISGTFSVSGGTYEISFAGVSNGASRYPQYSRVAKDINIPVGDGNLQKAMEYLQKQMNTRSSRNRTCVIEALKKSYPELGSDSLAELEEFREVRYFVDLDDAYKKNEYKIDTLDDLSKDVNTVEQSGGLIPSGATCTVEQVIRNVMNRCSRVQKDRTEGDENGYKYIFKIHSEISMIGKTGNSPITGTASEKDFVAVVYRIRRHVEFTNQVVQRVLSGEEGLSGEPADVTAAKIRENTIEFDYLFSGKNVDIVDFDLKMDMGLAFLQTLGSTNNIGTGTYQISGSEVGQIEEVSSDQNAVVLVGRENSTGGGDPNVSSDGENRPKILIRKKTPIFPATNVNNVFTKNVRGALDSTLYQAYMSRHAALESVEATVTIHGNPYMMSSTNRKASETQRRGNSSEPSVSDLMANWEYMPGLAKVNIWMPTSNDTPGDREVFRRERFWYDGYYYIYGIDHKFADGVFTQDLHLISLPNESLIEDKQESDLTPCWLQGEEKGSEGAASESSGQSEGEGVNTREAVAAGQIDIGTTTSGRHYGSNF